MTGFVKQTLQKYLQHAKTKNKVKEKVLQKTREKALKSFMVPKLHKAKTTNIPGPMPVVLENPLPMPPLEAVSTNVLGPMPVPYTCTMPPLEPYKTSRRGRFL